MITKKDLTKMTSPQIEGEMNNCLKTIQLCTEEIRKRHDKQIDWWTHYGQAVATNKPNADQFACQYADNIIEEEDAI